ncbi:hypothetical protein D3C87_1509250 [compost metagenome]
MQEKRLIGNGGLFNDVVLLRGVQGGEVFGIGFFRERIYFGKTVVEFFLIFHHIAIAHDAHDKFLGSGCFGAWCAGSRDNHIGNFCEQGFLLIGHEEGRAEIQTFACNAGHQRGRNRAAKQEGYSLNCFSTVHG